MTISSPATTRLDLPVDLHTFTDDLVWGYLDDGRDPDQVVAGAEQWVGSRRHAVRARVEQLTDEPSGTIVTLRLLDYASPTRGFAGVADHQVIDRGVTPTPARGPAPRETA